MAKYVDINAAKEAVRRAEYIDKAVALSIHEPIKSNRHYQTDNLDDAYGRGWDDALCSIEHIPAADVAPVVRCKDCEYSWEDIGGLTCSYGCCVDCIVREDFFCADGERKEEIENESNS